MLSDPAATDAFRCPRLPPGRRQGLAGCPGLRTRRLLAAWAERSPSRLSSATARGALAARRIYRLSRKCPFVKPSARCPCPKPPRPAESPGPHKLPGPPPQGLWLWLRLRLRVVAHVDVALQGCALHRLPLLTYEICRIVSTPTPPVGPPRSFRTPKPRKGDGGVSLRRRVVNPRHPLHVTMRMKAHLARGFVSFRSSTTMSIWWWRRRIRWRSRGSCRGWRSAWPEG
jgi:hypothetical protein